MEPSGIIINVNAIAAQVTATGMVTYPSRMEGEYYFFDYRNQFGPHQYRVYPSKQQLPKFPNSGQKPQ